MTRAVDRTAPRHAHGVIWWAWRKHRVAEAQRYDDGATTVHCSRPAHSMGLAAIIGISDQPFRRHRGGALAVTQAANQSVRHYKSDVPGCTISSSQLWHRPECCHDACKLDVQHHVKRLDDVCNCSCSMKLPTTMPGQSKCIGNMRFQLLMRPDTAKVQALKAAQELATVDELGAILEGTPFLGLLQSGRQLDPTAYTGRILLHVGGMLRPTPSL